MNNFMANLFETLIAVVGFIGLVGSFPAAYFAYNDPVMGGALMAVATFFGSILFTVVICGFSAVVIDIRHKLYRVGIQK